MPADNMNLQDASAHEDVPAHYIRRRHLIVALLMMGNFVSYCLRMSMSTAAQKPRKSGEGSEDETLSTEFNWSDFQLGVALGAFYAGYLFLQIPVKWMLRYISAKHIFALGILGASTMTLITPICASQYWLLILVRFCTGGGFFNVLLYSPALTMISCCCICIRLAEGVTYPSMAHLIVSWSPLQERTRALAITSSGAYLGTAAALPTSGYVLSSLGWRAIFYIYGILGSRSSSGSSGGVGVGGGLVWITVWMTAGAESPEAHKSINPGEAAYILATRDCGKKSQSSLPTFPPHRCINSSTTTNNNKGKRKSIQNLIDRAADGDGSLIDVKSSSPLVGNQNAHGDACVFGWVMVILLDLLYDALGVPFLRIFGPKHVGQQGRGISSKRKKAKERNSIKHQAKNVNSFGGWGIHAAMGNYNVHRMDFGLYHRPKYALTASDEKGDVSRRNAPCLRHASCCWLGQITLPILHRSYVDSVDGAIVLITLAIGIAGVSFSGVWTHVLDVSGEHSALLYATANVAATVPGFVSPLLVGLFLEVAGEKQGWGMWPKTKEQGEGNSTPSLGFDDGVHRKGGSAFVLR
eukprot:jgi/Bigna1/70475/fgenesh1_pg.12_\